MKSRGEMLFAAFCANGPSSDGWLALAPAVRESYDQAAAEYDKARSQLPDDVEAFVQEVEGRANKATPGPWTSHHYGPSDCRVRLDIVGHNEPVIFLDDRTYGSQTVGGCGANVQNADDDARFIAHTREDVPRLIAIVREQGAELEQARRAVRTDAEILAASMHAEKELRDRLTVIECLQKAGLAELDRMNMVNAQLAGEIERCDALRERLAKLEGFATRLDELDKLAGKKADEHDGNNAHVSADAEYGAQSAFRFAAAEFRLLLSDSAKGWA
jgi:hypothetical protein